MSPGRFPSRAVMSKTARLGIRFAQLTNDSEFPTFTDLDFETHFEVRGITISSPWEHSSSNVIKLT